MSHVKILSLTILLASCDAGNAEKREVAANDSLPVATEVGMMSDSVSSNTAVDAQSLEGPMWRLIDYAGPAGARTAPSNRTAIRLTDGELNGTGGCNRIGAAYTISGEQLTIGATRSSMRACMGDANVHESAFLALLATVRSYAIADGRLTLRSSGGEPLLVFAPEVERPIFGRAWTVMNYNNGQGGVSTVLSGTPITLTLAADGSVSGNAGCNMFRSSYTASGTSVSFTPAAVTKKLCSEPAGLMQQESAILAALGKVVSYAVEDDTLQLRGADGELLLLLRPEEAPSP